MAGVTDRAFRRLCRAFGAGMAVSEMVSAKPELRASAKTLRRLDHAGEPGPVAVQIVGADPAALAQAARHNVELGAQIIDINMGCAARKVCNVHAGSALLANESLVGRIIRSVTRAVEVPVTVKIRTGADPRHRNAVAIGKIAQYEGAAGLAIHGRTRSCGFGGDAEYETIAAVKAAVGIPVIANGDIDTPWKAKSVLDYTRADALMIGRAAQGKPWIFREIQHFLDHGTVPLPASVLEIREVLTRHLHDLYALYGELIGVRVARKHFGWYTRNLDGMQEFRSRFNGLENCAEQLSFLHDFFAELECGDDRLGSRQELAA